MDTNYDGTLIDPVNSGATIHGIPVLVWSTGRDGEDARGNPRAPENRDNVYTWR